MLDDNIRFWQLRDWLTIDSVFIRLIKILKINRNHWFVIHVINIFNLFTFYFFFNLLGNRALSVSVLRIQEYESYHVKVLYVTKTVNSSRQPIVLRPVLTNGHRGGRGRHRPGRVHASGRLLFPFRSVSPVRSILNGPFESPDDKRLRFRRVPTSY